MKMPGITPSDFMRPKIMCIFESKRDDAIASQSLAVAPPTCRFHPGDKVKIPYISDCNKHNIDIPHG